MNRILIIGPKESGKSNLARSLTIRTSVMGFDDVIPGVRCRTAKEYIECIRHALNKVPEHINTVQFDDIPAKFINEVIEYFFEEEICINPMHYAPRTIRPTIILICECEVYDISFGQSMLRRYLIYYCEGFKPLSVSAKILNNQYLMMVDDKKLSK